MGLARPLILAAGLSYGLVHFVLQHKGYPYHLFPFDFFLFTGIGVVTGVLIGT
jgi:hypothetical protein